jgi:anti-anti-sigma regulatory factor
MSSSHLKKSHVELQAADEYPVIALSGYFDESLAVDLGATIDALLRDGKTSLIIDFGACSAINSLAVGALQSMTMKVVEDFQGSLVLIRLSSTTERVFELAAIIPFAHPAPDLPAAIALMKKIE